MQLTGMQLLHGSWQKVIVSDETDLNIYDGGRDDWPDMNTVNETGPMAGRFLYRTHELRYPDNQPEGGTVSVIDLKTGETTILAQDPSYNALEFAGRHGAPWFLPKKMKAAVFLKSN